MAFNVAKYRPYAIPTLIVIDILLSILVVLKVPYTEIDWIAYMQEVAGFLGGELDYVNLRGDTGPLVYPAGFVYIFSALYYITDLGENIYLAQWLWLVLYIVTTAIVMRLYYRGGTGTLLIVPLILSKRIHSIFMLRMFNDCIAMAFAYAAFAAIVMGTRPRWSLASVLYSLGVSVKMNLFLFAPGLFFIWMRCLGVVGTIKQIAICAAVQILLGAPFLSTFPVSYVTKAFELSRVFTYKWTVNFRFLSEEVFVSKHLGLLLLTLTIVAWLVVWRRRWAPRKVESVNAALILATLFESNLIGIAFSRTLHYQFYVWFFHQLPFVLFFSCARLPYLVRLAIIVAVEIAFNVYPSTSWSSGLLVGSLWLLVASMLTSDDNPNDAKRAAKSH